MLAAGGGYTGASLQWKVGPMMIRRHLDFHDFNLDKGLGWARSAHLWTLERMIAADCIPGDIRSTAIALVLRALRAVPLFRSRACESEGRAVGLPDGAQRVWSFAC
jgi:hypothetical protein